MATKFWTNVAMDVQSAIAAAVAITAITKANPGVVTSVAHGLLNGDYLVLKVQGMRELNDRVVRVANKTLDTFELDSVNTINFGTFTSGTFQKVTLGAALQTISSVSASGGDPEFEDLTLIHDDIRIQAPTVNSAFTLSMESIWEPADVGLVELKTASDTKTQRVLRITFADGAKIAITGFVSATLIPTGQAPGKVTTSVTFTALGRPSVWTT